MTDDADARVAAIINGADEFIAAAALEPAAKPKLHVRPADPDRTVADLCEVLSNSRQVYDRGAPVRIVPNAMTGGVSADPLTPDSVVLLVHQLARPYTLKVRDGMPPEQVNARLPKSTAQLYLAARGDWKLLPLNGIASTPLLRSDGSIHSAPGYDAVSGCWLERVPPLSRLIPARPSFEDAQRALMRLRSRFASFCFADSPTVRVPDLDSPLVDLEQPAGSDESAFITSMVTAVCRPSLDLAPGVLIRAAPMSGSGTGKGLLARCLCQIAFGREPAAVTAGGKTQELEARLAAELMASGPVILLDNLNDRALKSDLLASALTERPARVRVLGKSEMVPMNATALIMLTGNGLSMSEDLARRFIAIDLDSKLEDPEARSFHGDIRKEVIEQRAELLAAVLIIWRWGRQCPDLVRGQPLGSYDQWCEWVRDPLLTLDCRDPVIRTRDAKQHDPRRQNVADLYRIWLERHQHRPVAASDVHEDVRNAIDQQGRGRQFVAAKLKSLTGTRIAGHVLTLEKAGKWGQTTYALLPAPES